MFGCIFRFALDCNLALPTGTAFRMVVDDVPALCVFNAYKGNRVFSFNFQNYDWLNKANIDKENYEIFRVLDSRENGDEVPFRNYYTEKNGDAFSAGVVDDITYSICEVLFNIPSMYYVENPEKINEVQTWVLKVITELCDIYRLITGDMTFTRSCVADSPIVDVLVSTVPIDFNEGKGASPFKQHIRALIWTHPEKTGHAKPTLSNNFIEEIGAFLASGEKIELHHRLMLDAKEQAILRENHDLSVILIENAFEVFLQAWLIRLCEDRGVEKLPIGKKKEYEKGYREAILNGNVREDLLPFYTKVLTGVNPAGTTRYNKWYEQAYQLRNDIIHKGKYETTSDQSFKAYKSTMEFMSYLEELFHGKLGKN